MQIFLSSQSHSAESSIIFQVYSGMLLDGQFARISILLLHMYFYHLMTESPVIEVGVQKVQKVTLWNPICIITQKNVFAHNFEVVIHL